MRTVLRPLLLSAALLAALPGCANATAFCKLIGICRGPRFVLPPEMPPDFFVVVSVRDQLDPATDYELQVNRDGHMTYDVTVRAPRRKQRAGTLEITENQVLDVWHAVNAAEFDKLSDRYPARGDGEAKKSGVQRLRVFADGLDKTVDASYEANPQLETVRKAVLAIVPKEILAASPVSSDPSSAPKEYIADTASHLFHRPECEKLKEVPPARRQTFLTPLDAVNFRYDPCPDCHPIPGR